MIKSLDTGNYDHVIPAVDARLYGTKKVGGASINHWWYCV